MTIRVKILFDFQGFRQRFGGIPRYYYELIKGLHNKDHKAELPLLFTQCEYILSDARFSGVNPIGFNSFRGRNRLNSLLTLISKEYSKYLLNKKEFDIFHPTYYDPYFLSKLKKPFVLTIHDFVHEKFIQYDVDEIAKKKILIEKADHIIAISENTKSDIISYYAVPEEKISVIYHGYNMPNELEYKDNTFGKYLLYVGSRHGYKNFDRFITAISPLLKEDKSLKLICTGSSFTGSENQKFRSLDIAEQLLLISANEQELNSLYKNALLFVYPSLYEGFGLPILEAFANNCPICISNSSCFPEIAKDAALYFDPSDEHSIYKSVKAGIADLKSRERLIKAGKLRLLDFSWDKTVSETIEVYESLMSN